MIGIELLPLTQPRFCWIKSCNWPDNRVLSRSARRRATTATNRFKPGRRLAIRRLIVVPGHWLPTRPIFWPYRPRRTAVISLRPDQSWNSKPQDGKQSGQDCKDQEWTQKEPDRTLIETRICQESALLGIRRFALKRWSRNGRRNP